MDTLLQDTGGDFVSVTESDLSVDTGGICQESSPKCFTDLTFCTGKSPLTKVVTSDSLSEYICTTRCCRFLMIIVYPPTSIIADLRKDRHICWVRCVDTADYKCRSYSNPFLLNISPITSPILVSRSLFAISLTWLHAVIRRFYL